MAKNRKRERRETKRKKSGEERKKKEKKKRKEESEVKSCGWWVLKCVCIYKIAIITLFL